MTEPAMGFGQRMRQGHCGSSHTLFQVETKMQKYESKIFSRGMDDIDLLLLRINRAIAGGDKEEAVASVAEARELLGSVASILLGIAPPKDRKGKKVEVPSAVTGICDGTAIDQIFSLLVARDNNPVTFQDMKEAGIEYRAARQCVYASARRMPAFERIKLGRNVAVKLKPGTFELLQKRYARDQQWSTHPRPATVYRKRSARRA